MSAFISSSTCAGSTSNQVLPLTNQVFQDAGSWNMLGVKQQNNRRDTNSFRSISNFEKVWQENETDSFDDWNQFVQQKNEIRNEWYTIEQVKEEEEEFRQEWSDERFTEMYIKQNGMDQLNNDKNSFSQEFLESTTSFQQFSIQEYSTFTTNTTNTTYMTQHNDLLQAQLYLIDHILFKVISYSLLSTCRPSPKTEWNWTKLFSPSRWCETEVDENDKILQDEYLKNMALGRLKILFGHLDVEASNKTNVNENQTNWEWEWELHGS
ncbi:hypothetical protein Glove_242g72 [Diversispora epigaea]|uniref:Uncharacterized protein n=1 Tax=Diversispora epigaea TaxID=1348612 RepID=A0A397ICE4_9GLOM|nr:hypothetical protein Glove_242g72 [Diversispora epigaea]